MNFASLQSAITDEERMLLRRCEELASRAADGSPAFSQLLSPREQLILRVLGPASRQPTRANLALDDSICFFWGGYPEAERAIFCALPSYFAYSLPESCGADDADSSASLISGLAAAASDELSGALRLLRIKSSGYVNLTHRDYLGSLLALGLERSVVGDILPDEGGAYVFAAGSVADFIKSELVSIGRDRVSVSDAVLPDGHVFTRQFESITGTIASARLDAVISELGRTSRETAKELIRRGLVEQNYFTAAEPDAPVENGDVVSIRREGRIRFGKYLIDSLDEQSAKGRIRLKARKYL